VSSQLISIILPIHNQADHIKPIVEDYLAQLANLPGKFEIILVSNASTDNTYNVACELANKYNGQIKTIDTPIAGWGHAVKLGLKEAKGDLLCYTNSARTSSEILKLILIYALSYSNVVIKANRKIRDNFLRRLGSLIYNLECRALFDLPNWDINGTPKVFPRSFNKLLDLSRDDDLIDAEFNAICRKEGYQILEVPVLSTRRHSGKSTTNFKSALKMYWGAYKLWQNIT
jgi:glycosyltransferase involved in cell wall biosynthesis